MVMLKQFLFIFALIFFNILSVKSFPLVASVECVTVCGNSATFFQTCFPIPQIYMYFWREERRRQWLQICVSFHLRGSRSTTTPHSQYKMGKKQRAQCTLQTRGKLYHGYFSYFWPHHHTPVPCIFSKENSKIGFNIEITKQNLDIKQCS